MVNACYRTSVSRFFLNVKEKLKRILNSKFIIMALFAAMVVAILSPPALNATADDGDVNGIGVVYQHYLLLDPTKVKEVEEGAESKDVEVLGVALGSFGSGGVSGEFSYDDIVSKANKNEKEQAKKFSVMMATYSTFNYISTKPQGFSAILSIFVRPLCGTVLLLMGVIEDVKDIIIKMIPSVLGSINIIPMLSSLITGSSSGSALQTALGFSAEKFKKFVDAGLIFALCSMLITIVFMLKRGSANIDQRHADKLKGKLATLILLPLFVVGSAELFNTIDSIVYEGKSEALFSQYLIDVDGWAKDYNFNPTAGSSGELSMTKPSSGYVDLSYNPYTDKGRERAGQINKESTLVNGTPFPNASLALSYLTSTTFNAQSFIDYKGTAEAQSSNSIGAFRGYATNHKEELKDVDNGYTGSMTGVSNNVSPTGYKEAVDDYLNDDGDIDNAVQAWKDRFIYGVKNSGNLLEEYYEEPPSTEQARTSVGGGANNYSLSNQSMFLALSSTFNTTGGYYLIDAPARGIMSAKNVFDSNRANYYSTSMTGNTLFTMLALITQPLMGLVVLLAMLSVIVAVGIIDMNWKPIRAYGLGLFKGDFEYPQAFLIYALGIWGTILMIGYMPQMFLTVLSFVSQLIVDGITLALGGDKTAMSPSSSMVTQGFTILIGAILAIFITFKYFKDRTFRERITGFFTLVWAWASVTGERLEEQAMPTANRIEREMNEIGKRDGLSKLYDRSEDINRTGEELSEAYEQDGFRGVARTAFRKTMGDDGFKEIPFSRRNNPNDETKENDDEKFKNDTIERIDNNLTDLRVDTADEPEINNEVQRSINRVDDFKDDPTKENYDDALNQLHHTRDVMIRNGASEEDIAKIDNLIDDFRDVNEVDLNIDRPENNLNNFIPDSDKSINGNGQLVDENNQPISPNNLPPMLQAELADRNLTIDENGQLRDENNIPVNNFGESIQTDEKQVDAADVVKTDGQGIEKQTVEHHDSESSIIDKTNVFETEKQGTEPKVVETESIHESEKVDVFETEKQGIDAKDIESIRVDGLENVVNQNETDRANMYETGNQSFEQRTIYSDNSQHINQQDSSYKDGDTNNFNNQKYDAKTTNEQTDIRNEDNRRKSHYETFEDNVIHNTSVHSSRDDITGKEHKIISDYLGDDVKKGVKESTEEFINKHRKVIDKDDSK